jgi:GrpB-like predicted nucleotidyltransferase (UPF0157 family)
MLRYVAVRDFLRSHPEEAARYEALKRGLEARALEWAKPGARHGAR